jgi:hypothetical protein
MAMFRRLPTIVDTWPIFDSISSSLASFVILKRTEEKCVKLVWYCAKKTFTIVHDEIGTKLAKNVLTLRHIHHKLECHSCHHKHELAEHYTLYRPLFPSRSCHLL